MRLNRWGSNPTSSASTSTLSSATGLGGRGRGTPARGRGPLQGGDDGGDGPLLEGVAHPPHQVQAPRPPGCGEELVGCGRGNEAGGVPAPQGQGARHAGGA